MLTKSIKLNCIINIVAGWSSPVARRAHNPKVAGSNPAPAIWSRGVAVNMPACHAGDRRFDSGRDRHFNYQYHSGSVAQSVEQIAHFLNKLLQQSARKTEGHSSKGLK